MQTFRQELRELLNRYGKDSHTGVPDFILAQFIESMLDNMRTMNEDTMLYYYQINEEMQNANQAGDDPP